MYPTSSSAAKVCARPFFVRLVTTRATRLGAAGLSSTVIWRNALWLAVRMVALPSLTPTTRLPSTRAISGLLLSYSETCVMSSPSTIRRSCVDW